MLTQVSTFVYFALPVLNLSPPLAAPGASPDASFSESAIWYFNEGTKQLTRS